MSTNVATDPKPIVPPGKPPPPPPEAPPDDEPTQEDPLEPEPVPVAAPSPARVSMPSDPDMPWLGGIELEVLRASPPSRREGPLFGTVCLDW